MAPSLGLFSQFSSSGLGNVFNLDRKLQNSTYPPYSKCTVTIAGLRDQALDSLPHLEKLGQSASRSTRASLQGLLPLNFPFHSISNKYILH